LPRQIEFARANITYVVLSKRKLIQLVEEKHVDGWDDPRMPTLVGARRRGFTPEGFGCSPSASACRRPTSGSISPCSRTAWREHLNEVAPRRVAVLDPVKLVIENYPEGKEETCEAPNHPHKPEWGSRALPFSRELWIEREDFAETPPKATSACFPANKVRLRLRLRGRVHRLRQGYGHRALQVRPRHPVRTPGAEKSR